MNLPLVKLFPLGVSGLALMLASCSAANPPGDPGEPVGTTSAAIDATPVATFGANPGNLLMYSYIPQAMPQSAPLVLSLHGCTEEVSGDQAPAMEAAGWNALADQYKFYLVYPQQQTANNTEGCFNFFGNTSGSLADITRGQGEAESIHEMVTYMQSTYSVDPSRIYVTGFSAGAAYAVALLALYPDVFAAGASFEGIAFGCATSLTSAYTCMYTTTSDTASQWEMLGKNGDPGYSGPYPRISVWEGSSDTTVVPANQAEIVSQWTALTGASTSPSSMTSSGSYTHATYTNGSGEALVETYTISGMSHAVAIDPTNNCGTAGTYFVDEGVCAADEVAKFFGLEGPQPSAADDAGGAAGTDSGQNGQGQGNGGTGMNNLGSSGSGSGKGGSGTGSGSGGSAADAPDAGTGPDTMPGCSAAPTRATTGAGMGMFGFALAALAFARRRSRGVGSRGVGNRKGRGLLAAAMATLFVVCLLGVPGVARADEGDAPPPDTTTKSKPAILGPQGAFFTGASVNTTPALLFGVFPIDHFATTVGLGMSYNANGSPVSPLTGIKGAPNNRFGADFMLDGMYFVYDKAPFAMGPELNLIGSLSPNYPLTVVVVTPMWALRYAPWRAPIAIGTGLGAGIAFERGAKPVVNLATQGLDIVYAF